MPETNQIYRLLCIPNPDKKDTKAKNNSHDLCICLQTLMFHSFQHDSLPRTIFQRIQDLVERATQFSSHCYLKKSMNITGYSIVALYINIRWNESKCDFKVENLPEFSAPTHTIILAIMQPIHNFDSIISNCLYKSSRYLVLKYSSYKSLYLLKKSHKLNARGGNFLSFTNL